MSTPDTPLGARYNVLRELGEGGFGRTYLAEDLHRFKELCVLKEFVPQIEDPNLLAKAQELFEREAKVLYQLQHPQIPKFRELMREGEQLFLVQDYAEGATYRSLLQSRQDYDGHFSETEITQLMYQLLPVLDYIHGLDIIHRDISPENLILRSQDGKPVLIDFGSVKQIAATVEQELSAEIHQTRIGKAGYVPPEQFHSGAVDATSDLYGLAATLVVLATGKEPQELYDAYESAWRWEQFVTFGEPLNQVLKKMLAPSSAQRYPSATAVMQALRGAQGLPGSEAEVSANGGAPMFSEESDSATDEDMVGVYPTTDSTQVASSAPESTTISTATAPDRRTDNTGLFQAAIGLLALLGISSLLLAFLVGFGLRPRWPFGSNADDQSTDQVIDPQTGLTPDEIARKEEITQRRQALGINEAWFNLWVNQQFYQQYPNLRGRPLTDATDDAPLRLRWDNLAMDSLDLLELHLSMPARRGLGAYGADDRESWRQTVNGLNVSSRALEDLTDAKFVSIFPEQPPENVLDQPVGQIWYGLAQDSVVTLQDGRALERIEFEAGSFRQRLTGQLAPGQGRVYVLNLQEGQNLRINLQAPENSVLMSLYLPTPTQQAPFLLSDSSETTWSGRLDQSGFYEIAIASQSPAPINYALSVAVDNIRNTQPEEEDPAETPEEEPAEPDPETEDPADSETDPPAEEDTNNEQESEAEGVNF